MAFKHSGLLFAIVPIVAGGTGAAHGQTLPEALVRAYQNNPTITGARASQQVNIEQVAIELAPGRPNAAISGTVNDNFERSDRFTPRNSVSATGSASLPIYSGGTIRYSIRSAKSAAQSGGYAVKATQADVFGQVVAAYVNVLRDTEIVQFNEQNVASLRSNLSASTKRYNAGDLTKTDITQSETRLSLAQANLDLAKAQLTGSQETFLALVGTAPEKLEVPPPLSGLPTSVDEAVESALVNNPELIAAKKFRDATAYSVRAAQGQIAPRISVFASNRYVHYLGTENSNPLLGIPSHTMDATAGISFTVPLYQGGLPGAQSRQAIARDSAAIERATELERQVIEDARSAYANWKGTQSAIAYTAQAAESAAIALQSVKAENSAGTRTVLDILNAEQEMLSARIQLAQARRNAYFASFSLLVAMGKAQPEDLGLGVDAIYDPVIALRSARHKIFDFDFGRSATPQATSTVEVVMQKSQVGGTP